MVRKVADQILDCPCLETYSNHTHTHGSSFTIIFLFLFLLLYFAHHFLDDILDRRTTI